MPLNVRQYSKTDYDTVTNLKATCNLGGNIPHKGRKESLGDDKIIRC